MYLNYCKEKSERFPSIEVSLCDYFTMLCDSGRYFPETFWCMRSTLPVHMLCTHGVNIKTFVRLKSLIKKVTIDQIKKRLDMFSFEEIRIGLTEMFFDSDKKTSM